VWVFWGGFFRWDVSPKTHRVFWVRTRVSEPWISVWRDAEVDLLVVNLRC